MQNPPPPPGTEMGVVLLTECLTQCFTPLGARASARECCGNLTYSAGPPGRAMGVALLPVCLTQYFTPLGARASAGERCESDLGVIHCLSLGASPSNLAHNDINMACTSAIKSAGNIRTHHCSLVPTKAHTQHVLHSRQPEVL